MLMPRQTSGRLHDFSVAPGWVFAAENPSGVHNQGMKTLNDFEAVCVLGAAPTDNSRRSEDRFPATMPLCWTDPEGRAHYLFASSLGRITTRIKRHLDPGAPVLVAGRLSLSEDGRLVGQIEDLQRFPTDLPTREVEWTVGRRRLLALAGGGCRVHLRGILQPECEPVQGGFRGRMKTRYTLQDGRVRYQGLPFVHHEAFVGGEDAHAALYGEVVCTMDMDGTDAHIRAHTLHRLAPLNPLGGE